MKAHAARSTLNAWTGSRDGRHGVMAHEGSAANTFIVDSRAGCWLRVPPELLRSHAGTITLEQYHAWEDQQ